MPKKEENRKKLAAKNIASLAMLTAVSVVLGIVCKNLFTVGVYYRFTLENLGVIFAGVCFGPAAGALVGFTADAVSCLLSTNPAINPIISAGAITVGAVSGAVSRLMKHSGADKRLILSAASAHLLGQVIIKSVGKTVYYGMPWYGVFIGILTSALACCVEVAVIRVLYKNREINKLLHGIKQNDI